MVIGLLYLQRPRDLIVDDIWYEEFDDYVAICYSVTNPNAYYSFEDVEIRLINEENGESVYGKKVYKISPKETVWIATYSPSSYIDFWYERFEPNMNLYGRMNMPSSWTYSQKIHSSSSSDLPGEELFTLKNESVKVKDQTLTFTGTIEVDSKNVNQYAELSLLLKKDGQIINAVEVAVDVSDQKSVDFERIRTLSGDLDFDEYEVYFSTNYYYNNHDIEGNLK